MTWRRIGVLVLATAALGLPINHVSVYAVLLLVAVIVFTGEVTARSTSWIAALAIAVSAVFGQWLIAPPRIDEGHNVFLPDAQGIWARALPDDVYRSMAAQFDAIYPPAVRCQRGTAGCWRDSKPARTFAFSADGIFHRSDLSRAAARIDFSDPVWLRLGFANERQYNWHRPAPDVHRVDRDRRFYMGLHRWHFALPWFEMIRLPAAYAGGELCWRGELLWEEADGHFAPPLGNCRTISKADAGKRVFGIAIKPDTLAMHLSPPWRVRLLQFACKALALAAVVAIVTLLVRLSPQRMIVPVIFIGLAVLVIALDDASFLGGVRPFDGGDDGLFYDGVGREMLQKLLAGDIWGFLQGGENVFYYGGPGLRYFRAIEHVPFGESYLGYLTVVLSFPLLLWALLRRFVAEPWPLAATLVFVAVPVGALFGTTFYQYAQWAGRGFADPAAYIFFVAALCVLLRAGANFSAAFLAALLFAVAIFMKPIVAPAAAVMLGGAGLATLWHVQWRRLGGLVAGFLPVFSMALHNWVFGHVFVLFSANAGDSQLLVMPPSAYLAALSELAGGGPHLAQAGAQILHWLSGPAQSYATIPLNAAGLAVVVLVAVSRRFDPWLRLIAAAALAQQTVALFYDAAIARYHFLAWLLTMVVVVVWLHDVGLPWLQGRYPVLCKRAAVHPWRMRLASGLAWLQEWSA
jgi:hypothetical protein